MQGALKNVYIFSVGVKFLQTGILIPEVNVMKQQEKENEGERKPIPWEAADPKPPIIQSGHMENRIRN